METISSWKKQYRALAEKQKRKITFSKNGVVSVSIRNGTEWLTSKATLQGTTLQMETFEKRAIFLDGEMLSFVIDLWVDYARLCGATVMRIDYAFFRNAFPFLEKFSKEDNHFFPACGFKTCLKESVAQPDGLKEMALAYEIAYDQYEYVLQIEEYRSLSPFFDAMARMVEGIKSDHPLLKDSFRTTPTSMHLFDWCIRYLGYQGTIEFELENNAGHVYVKASYKEQTLIAGAAEEVAARIALFVAEIEKKQRIKNIFTPPYDHVAFWFRDFVWSPDIEVREPFAKETMHYFIQKGFPYEKVELAAKQALPLAAELKSGFLYHECTVPFLGHLLFFYQTDADADSHFRIFETEEALFSFYTALIQEQLPLKQKAKQQALQAMKAKADHE